MPEPHRNFMPAWDEIRCQRVNHGRHHSMPVEIDLSKHLPHSDVPDPYTLWIWDPAVHPVDGGPYCPAHDAVSATIWDYGIWEPRETAVALWAFRHAKEGQGFVDFGAQIGWYSTIAVRCGIPTLAVECDEHNANMLEENLQGAWTSGRTTSHADEPDWAIHRARIGPISEFDSAAIPGGACLVKIDIEGAESDAIDLLRPSIEAGLVDRILMEVSPVFADYYGDLVVELIDMGYDALVVPTAEEVMPGFDGSCRQMQIYTLCTQTKDRIVAEVNSWHQKDVLFVREGVA